MGPFGIPEGRVEERPTCTAELDDPLENAVCAVLSIAVRAYSR